MYNGRWTADRTHVAWVTCVEKGGQACITSYVCCPVLDNWLQKAYRQLCRRAASLSPKSRPKVHLPARSVLCLPEILSQPLAQCAKRTGLLMTDASHRIAKPAPQSAALYLPPLSHTGRPPSARMVFSLFCRQQLVSSFGKNSLLSWRESGI